MSNASYIEHTFINESLFNEFEIRDLHEWNRCEEGVDAFLLFANSVEGLVLGFEIKLKGNQIYEIMENNRTNLEEIANERHWKWSFRVSSDILIVANDFVDQESRRSE